MNFDADVAAETIVHQRPDARLDCAALIMLGTGYSRVVSKIKSHKRRACSLDDLAVQVARRFFDQAGDIGRAPGGLTAYGCLHRK